MDNRQKTLSYLKEFDISFVETHHPPVFTVEEANLYWENIEGLHCKNIFLRNNNGKKHFLVVTTSDKKLNMAVFKELLGERLGFASPERLKKWLGLEPGSVSPFGLINDVSNHVIAVFDKELLQHNKINFHPCVNTATLTLATSDFKRFLHSCGNDIVWVNI